MKKYFSVAKKKFVDPIFLGIPPVISYFHFLGKFFLGPKSGFSTPGPGGVRRRRRRPSVPRSFSDLLRPPELADGSMSRKSV